MKIKLTKIVVDDREVEGPASGSCYFDVNGKSIEVIIHLSGELDFEGPELSDEEFNLVLNTLHTNKEVQAAFPSDSYDE